MTDIVKKRGLILVELFGGPLDGKYRLIKKNVKKMCIPVRILGDYLVYEYMLNENMKEVK